MRVQRPQVRSDCLPGVGFNVQRPCPWVSCRWHVWKEMLHGGSREEDVSPVTMALGKGKAREARLPKWDPTSLPSTCVLDLSESEGDPGAGRGAGMTLEQVGGVLGITRERVRQIEAVAMKKIRGEASVPENPEKKKRMEAGIQAAQDALELVHEFGGAGVGNAAGFVWPEAGPLLTRADRKRIRGLFRDTGNCCKRPGCHRPVKLGYGARRKLVQGFCSRACAKADDVIVVR